MSKSKRKIAYEKNKKAKVGDEITCPICGTKFKKRQYSQAFCDSKCKDTYWNAKGDRHSVDYYEKYDNKHPERKLRKALYSIDVINSRDADELEARMALINDEGFRRYVNGDCDVCGIPDCNIDLMTIYKNYLGID